MRALHTGLRNLKPVTKNEKNIQFCILAFGVWLHAACSMLAATTLPSAIDEIGGASIIGWAFTLYQLGSIVAGAATALLIARLGFKYALLVAGCIYIMGSLICAIAPSMSILVSGRLIQGCGGGWLVALTFVVTNREFPPEKIPKLQAILSAVWSVSAFCGPLIGGTFSTIGLWRVAFWAFAMQGVLFLIAAGFVFKESPTQRSNIAEAFPLIRLSILASGVLLIAFAGLNIHPLLSLLLLVCSFCLFRKFLALDQQTVKSRMFPAQPFNLHHKIGAGLVLVFTAASTTMTFIVFGPYFLENLYALTPLTAGYIILLESIGWGAAALWFAKYDNDELLIRCGVFLVTVAVIGFAAAMPNNRLILVMVCALLQGAGFGMMWGFIIKRAVASVPQRERDVASSSLPTTQQTAFAVGAALAGLVANTMGFEDGASTQLVREVAFWVFAAFIPMAVFSNYAAWKFTHMHKKA